jgi:hypothetical protein
VGLGAPAPRRARSRGGAVIAALLASAALAALPEGTARWRAELAGEPVGAVELRIRCAGEACAVSYDSRLRLPAESGGAVERERVEVEVDRSGRWRGGPLLAARGGPLAPARGARGAIPAAVLEVVLAAEAGPERRCVAFFDEEDGAAATACVRAEGGRAIGDANGIAETIVAGEDGFPALVEVAGRFRFVRDPGAAVPERAPRLAGTRVAGPGDPARARAFCGVPRDPEPPRPSRPLPPPRAAGESCREKTAAWLASARARGLDGRTAVGVAWDGAAFVWHAWAEVQDGDAWIPVDPSFGELPARGPRFTVARYAGDDAGERLRAGARLLACWGAAAVR